MSEIKFMGLRYLVICLSYEDFDNFQTAMPKEFLDGMPTFEPFILYDRDEFIAGVRPNKFVDALVTPETSKPEHIEEMKNARGYIFSHLIDKGLHFVLEEFETWKNTVQQFILQAIAERMGGVGTMYDPAKSWRPGVNDETRYLFCTGVLRSLSKYKISIVQERLLSTSELKMVEEDFGRTGNKDLYFIFNMRELGLGYDFLIKFRSEYPSPISRHITIMSRLIINNAGRDEVHPEMGTLRIEL